VLVQVWGTNSAAAPRTSLPFQAAAAPTAPAKAKAEAKAAGAPAAPTAAVTVITPEIMSAHAAKIMAVPIAVPPDLQPNLGNWTFSPVRF
jgi:hypothetical protein